MRVIAITMDLILLALCGWAWRHTVPLDGRAVPAVREKWSAWGDSERALFEVSPTKSLGSLGLNYPTGDKKADALLDLCVPVVSYETESFAAGVSSTGKIVYWIQKWRSGMHWSVPGALLLTMAVLVVRLTGHVKRCLSARLGRQHEGVASP